VREELTEKQSVRKGKGWQKMSETKQDERVTFVNKWKASDTQKRKQERKERKRSSGNESSFS